MVQVIYRFDIKTVSEANQAEHWRKRQQRKKNQQLHFSILWRNQKGKITLPGIVTFTRYSCRSLDKDNLSGAFKHIQDQLAREIGIDDGSKDVEWRYRQERIRTNGNYFTITNEGLVI